MQSTNQLVNFLVVFSEPKKTLNPTIDLHATVVDVYGVDATSDRSEADMVAIVSFRINISWN